MLTMSELREAINGNRDIVVGQYLIQVWQSHQYTHSIYIENTNTGEPVLHQDTNLKNALDLIRNFERISGCKAQLSNK